MASRRTTFDKLQRERAKKAKAAAKRERRLEKSADEAGDESTGGVAGRQDNPADLLEEIAAVHARFEANEIEFEEFEELKTDLFERLAALPVES